MSTAYSATAEIALPFAGLTGAQPKPRSTKPEIECVATPGQHPPAPPRRRRVTIASPTGGSGAPAHKTGG